MHWEGVKTASRRAFGMTPWAGFHSSVNMWALEHRDFARGALKLGLSHWWALEWWHHFHRVLINWMSLHTSITRVPRATTPLQLCDGFMCHLVKWLVHQAIPAGSSSNGLKT